MNEKMSQIEQAIRRKARDEHESYVRDAFSHAICAALDGKRVDFHDQLCKMRDEIVKAGDFERENRAVQFYVAEISRIKSRNKPQPWFKRLFGK